MYFNSCCSSPFEHEIIKIGQSSHKMYSNNMLIFHESTVNLNACTKGLETYWRHDVFINLSILVLREFLPTFFNSPVYILLLVCVLVSDFCLFQFACCFFHHRLFTFFFFLATFPSVVCVCEWVYLSLLFFLFTRLILNLPYLFFWVMYMCILYIFSYVWKETFSSFIGSPIIFKTDR